MKKLEDMTVEALLELQHYSTCRCDTDTINNILDELIRRAKLAETRVAPEEAHADPHSIRTIRIACPKHHI